MSRRRLALIFALGTLLAVSWTARGSAQIVYAYPPPPYAYVNADASIRVMATPRQAEVYVDGYYAGIVDDFDGMFQRLRVSPGEHEITLYRDGYRAATQRIYVSADTTFKLKYAMQPLPAGEIAEPRPVPPNPQVPPQEGPIGRQPPRNLPPPNAGYPPPPQPNGGYPPPPEAGYPQQPPPQRPANGTLEIRVQPADAEILVDGQPWRMPDGQDRLVIDTSVGRHTIQVRKPGYVGYLTDVQVRPGQATPVNVNLRNQP